MKRLEYGKVKGAKMKTITLRADEALINQILAISKALAKEQNQELENITDEYELRADEALQGKGLISESEALARAEQIKGGIYASKI